VLDVKDERRDHLLVTPNLEAKGCLMLHLRA
jgi:hypothetical protein